MLRCCFLLDVTWSYRCVCFDVSSVFLQELTLNPLNYGLYLPATGKGKLGKFMNDSQRLIEYALEGKVPKLEVE